MNEQPQNPKQDDDQPQPQEQGPAEEAPQRDASPPAGEPQQHSATEQPPQAGGPPQPSLGNRAAAFLKRIPDDFRAARRSTSLAMSLRSLQHQRAERHQEFEDALRALGAAAEEADVENQHSAAERVVAARQRLTEAQNALEEKEAEFKEARNTLGAEQKSHTDVIRAREAEYEPLANALKATNARVIELDRKVSVAERDLKRLRSQLKKAQSAPPETQGQDQQGAAAAAPPKPSRSPEDIQREIETTEAERNDAQQQLDAAREKQSKAQDAADAKAAEVQKAKETWEERKAELTAAVEAADEARRKAQDAADEANQGLQAAHRDFGRAIFDAGSDAQALAEPLAQARQLQAAIDELDQQIAETKAERQALKGGTQRFAVTAAVGVVLLVLLILLLVWIF